MPSPWSEAGLSWLARQLRFEMRLESYNNRANVLRKHGGKTRDQSHFRCVLDISVSADVSNRVSSRSRGSVFTWSPPTLTPRARVWYWSGQVTDRARLEAASTEVVLGETKLWDYFIYDYNRNGVGILVGRDF